MTTSDIRARLANIDKSKGDSEVAHGMQDKLWEDVLRAIADGNCVFPQGCAAEALKVLDIDFSRWTA